MISMEHLQITVKAPTKPKRLDSSDAKNGGKQMQTERVSSNMGEQKTHRLNLQTGKYDNSEFPSLKKKKTIHVPRHPTACLCTVRKPACLSHYTTASQRGFEHVGILASKISLDGKW